MALNKEEKIFIQSIKEKIAEFNIKITLKEAFAHKSGIMTNTVYNDNTYELIDTGIEEFIIINSFAYFLTNYCKTEIPGLGVVPMKPYYFQQEMAKEILDYRKIVVDKTRQCLTKDNFVMTDRGYISIKDVKIGDRIETLIDGKVDYVYVTNFINQGKRDVCQVSTSNGMKVKCTPDHRIFTNSGWKEAKDLTKEDLIHTIKNKENFGTFKLDDDKMATLIGYYLADGKYSQPYFVNTNLDYINEVIESGELFENCSPYIYERNTIGNRQQAYEARLVSSTKNNKIERPVLDFMNRFGLNIPSENRALTEELMLLNKKQMSLMINRLFSGDGWVSIAKDKRRKSTYTFEIGIGSPCFKLIKQLEYILQSKYGISCTITKETEKEGKKDFWKLRVQRKKSAIKFLKEIGVYGKDDKKEVLDQLNIGETYKINNEEKFKTIKYFEEKEEVYDITTESGSFLVNGVLVHNCGISTIFSLYSLWRVLSFSSENIDVISLKQVKAQDFNKKFGSTLNSLPKWFVKPITINNQQKIQFLHPNGGASTIVSEAQAETAGRSESLSVLIMDEAAFYRSERMIDSIVSAAAPTLSKTGGQIIIISTPNGSTGPGAYYFKQVQEAKSGLNEDTKYLNIDWWEIPDDFRIKGAKKGNNKILDEAIKRDYYHNPSVKREIKKHFDPLSENPESNPWLKAAFNDIGDINYRQEILHEFIISGNRVLSPDAMDFIRSRLKEPIVKDYICIDGQKVEELKGLWTWAHPVVGRKYVLGNDVASGTSGDFSTIQILDVDNLEQVAEYKNYITTLNLPTVIKKLARIYNDALVIIESNSIGEGVFNAVYYDANDPYRNVFKQKRNKNGISRYTGWITDVKTRKLMTKEVRDWMVNPDMRSIIKIYSERILAELETWIVNSAGRFVHAKNCVSGDTIVTCIDGFKKIKNVKVGDFVLTEIGEFREVKETFKVDAEKEQVFQLEGYGMPKLNISSGQKILTYDIDGLYKYKTISQVNKGDFVYSKFSDLTYDIDGVTFDSFYEDDFKPSKEQLYCNPEIQIKFLSKLFMDNYRNDKKGNYILDVDSNLQRLYFVSHILYRNRVIFSMANNKIVISQEMANKLMPEIKHLSKNENRREPRRLIQEKFSSRLKEKKDIDFRDKYLYDINVDDCHTFIANGYIVHNCHDDAIMALGLALYNRDIGEKEDYVSMIQEDGTLISFDKNKEDKDLRTSSLDKSMRERYNYSGGNVGGIRSNTEEFSADEEDEKAYKMLGTDKETYDWLMG